MSGWDFSDDKETGGSIEPGEYTFTIAKAEVKETKSGTGEYISVTFKAERGVVFHMFNIKNDNAQAQSIGRGQLKTVMRLGGKADFNKLSDVNELIGLRVNAVVKIKSDPQYGDKPQITTFKEAPKSEASPFG